MTLTDASLSAWPLPWSMSLGGWGRGGRCRTPSSLWGGHWKREVETGCRGHARSPRQEWRGPAAPCHLLPQETRAAMSRAQEVVAPCCRAGDSLGPAVLDPSLGAPAPPPPSASATFHSQSFLVQKDQDGDPLSLPPPAPPFPPSSSPAALCPRAEQLPFQ